MGDALAQLWSRTVAREPAATAVIDAGSGQTWSRADLAAVVSAVRATLPPPDVMARCCVLLTAPNSPAWLAWWLALQEVGAIPVAVDADEPDHGQRAVADRLGAAWRWRGRELEALPVVPRRHRSGACLYKLTSGSTGMPRSLPFTAAQMTADGRQICATMGIGLQDVNLAIIPFGHSYGLGNLVLPLVLHGTAIVIGSGTLPQVIAADAAHWRPTVFPAVPALLRALTLSEVSATSLASLRLVISAGAVLTPEVARGFTEKFQRAVHGFYGSSETGGICFDRTGVATAAGRSVGHPLDGVRLEFSRGRRFAVASAAVMGRGRHVPPDLGELNEWGELVLLGRVGRMVKVAGRRLDLAEVEQALRAVPAVREAWACAHPCESAAVAAAVVFDGGASELRAALATRIPTWKIPDRLVVLREFPVTGRGKLDTRRLRALLGRR